MPHRRLPAVFRVASSPLQAPRRFRNPENRPELGPSRPRDHESQFSFDSKLISLLPLDDVPVHVHRFAARVPCDSQGSECQCGIDTAEAASALRSRKTERAAKEKPTPISHIFFSTCSASPFRVVPYFDPGPWGGHWMEEVCDLPNDKPNHAWCFDCVPEENSLLLGFGDVRVEIPALNVVFAHPRELLGDAVHGRFGAEFPIRFDFLDTMGGGNLSLQVHPLTEYIQDAFGMHYTQDESYYLLDAGPEGTVYLGLKEDADPRAMADHLREARDGQVPFDANRVVIQFPAKKP